MVGNIPQNITFIFSNKEKVGDIEVTPAYVSDSENEKTLQSGNDWARGRYYQKKKEVQTFTKPNSPFIDLRILDLVIRSEGGRAYKVVTPHGFYVDFREKELMDVIENVGIRAGGYLNGEFVFARVGSQMKPIRVGSEVYNELAKSTKLKTAPNIKDFTVGHLYKQRNGKSKIFLGRVNTVVINWVWEGQFGYSYFDNIHLGRAKIQSVKLLRNAYLWFEKPDRMTDIADNMIKSLYYYDITKSNEMKEDLGMFLSPVNLSEIISLFSTKPEPLSEHNFSSRKKTYEDRSSRFFYMQPADREFIIPDELKGYIK